MRVIVAGGGTGGHAFPALAIVAELRRRDPHLELWYVGRRGNIEERLAQERGIPFRAVAVGGLARRGGVRNLWSVLQMAVGVAQSLFLLLRFRPQVVVGTGGYVSVPPVFAARLLRIPTLIHEQNSIPGRANRLLGKWVTAVATTFQNSLSAFPADKTRVTGNPIRAELRPEALQQRDQADARAAFELAPDRPTVLVVGGSQGARALTDATLDAIERVEAREVQFLLVSGDADFEEADTRARRAAVTCRVRNFITDMAAAYAAADIVVCRAGASTLAEVTSAGLPAILVPYPYAVDDHQRINAEAVVQADAALLLPESDLTGASLAARLTEVLQDEARLRGMGAASARIAIPGAAENIADWVCDLAIPGGTAA